ncbi:hypothetical protein CIHG_02061 [Coccidioides immitis H538.4]|uniref:Uncharacterized protein n=2 Tax=Coccidioides immitis TaxID=5501 RepID=A0A0J8RGI3_COCIT|nr:hypothetical protein CIRG_00239 [Coccidioides immitis RMSCC 2394]KMU84275.1 hypothetical protein CIHG_02061 [Coccidioides immitis H538.4]
MRNRCLHYWDIAEKTKNKVARAGGVHGEMDHGSDMLKQRLQYKNKCMQFLVEFRGGLESLLYGRAPSSEWKRQLAPFAEGLVQIAQNSPVGREEIEDPAPLRINKGPLPL